MRLQAKSKHSTARRSGARLGIAGFVTGLLLIPAVAWAAGEFSDVPPSSPAYRSIMAIADAGLMTGSKGEFHPNATVTRKALAQVLHRGLQRVSVDGSVEDIPVSQQDPPLIAEVNMSVDGFQRGAQGVLLTLDMQVEAAQPLAADCTVVLYATSWPENFDVGTWPFQMYAGDESGSVSSTFLAGQLSGTAYTYEVTADNECGQPLNVVQGALVAQTAAFRGNGSAFDD